MSRTKHDRDLVAGMQPHEVETVQTHFDISTKELREVIKEFGHSLNVSTMEAANMASVAKQDLKAKAGCVMNTSLTINGNVQPQSCT
jgi:hypothetical protein